jgi:hypothetical protein
MYSIFNPESIINALNGIFHEIQKIFFTLSGELEFLLGKLPV